MQTSNLSYICVPTLLLHGAGVGSLPLAKEKEKKKKAYLLGGNFFAVTSPSGSTLNNQEQRIIRNIKTPISLVVCFRR